MRKQTNKSTKIVKETVAVESEIEQIIENTVNEIKEQEKLATENKELSELMKKATVYIIGDYNTRYNITTKLQNTRISRFRVEYTEISLEWLDKDTVRINVLDINGIERHAFIQYSTVYDMIYDNELIFIETNHSMEYKEFFDALAKAKGEAN